MGAWIEDREMDVEKSEKNRGTRAENTLSTTENRERRRTCSFVFLVLASCIG